jgi:hypothetical protein
LSRACGESRVSIVSRSVFLIDSRSGAGAAWRRAMADDGIVDRAMEANGYTINQNGGTYRHGVARPIEDKSSIARVYLELLAAAKADPTKVVSVREVARIGKCSRGFAAKCMREIESGDLVDPKRKIVARARGDGVIAISDKDGMYLLVLCQQNNKCTLRDYCIWLIEDRGVFVSPSVICKWFLNLFPSRGSLGKLNQVPLDKFSPENILRVMKHWEFIRQVDPYRLKFGDEKPLKGEDLFNRKGRADPLSGEREPIYVNSDFRNTYNIIGICGIARDTMPFVYKMHDGINNSALFSDLILESVACGFLRYGDILVLDNAAIHHYKDSSEFPGYLWSYHGVLCQPQKAAAKFGITPVFSIIT